jgi:hypothetical protein
LGDYLKAQKKITVLSIKATDEAVAMSNAHSIIPAASFLWKICPFNGSKEIISTLCPKGNRF